MEQSIPQPKTVNVTREHIRATKSFKSATKMIQLLTLKRTNFRCIQHGVNVGINIGFDNWEQQTNATFTNRNIIQELINNYKNENK